MISGKAQQVGNPERGGAEDIALRGNAVAVAADHLHDGIDAFFAQNLAGSHAAHAHDAGLVVGYVAGIDIALQNFGLFAHHFGLGAARRPRLGGYGEFAGFKYGLQI